MNCYEQFFILETEIYISKYGYVMSPHAASQDGYQTKENRYVIHSASGIRYQPATFYESWMNTGNCISCSFILNKTRKYQKELDRTYFKFYDDAEEVMNNLVAFYSWATKRTDKKEKKMMAEVILNVTEIQNFHSLKQSQIGLAKRLRKILGPLELSIQNEMDLVE